jgi:hypothetical protein
VHRLYEGQEHLRRDCETIEAYQEDLEADLNNIEEKLEKELLGKKRMVGRGGLLCSHVLLSSWFCPF